MSESRSSVRGPQLPPASGDVVEPRLDGSGSASNGRLSARGEQPTVISNRPASQTLVPISESAYRLLQGRIATGDHLGHFELVEYIGGGGMGRVFRALDTRLARHVAVKILAPEQAADAETRLRFQNEAQSAARLDHENIARVFYVGEDHGLQYIVFEYIEGDNVRDLVDRKGPLPVAEAVSFTLQVAEALAHASQRSVVHRDIKPSNVLITREGQVKLIDMGLARLRQVDAVADLTASGVTLGTFDYISPEQARDPRSADVRSDIYSLGCTLFFMLTGRPPFPDGTVLQKLLQHQGDQPPDVRQLRGELPDELARIVRKMLAKDPRHRYPTPMALVDDLSDLAAQLGLYTGGPANRVRIGDVRRGASLIRQHLPWLAPVLALVAIVVLLNFLWSLDSRQDDGVPPSDAVGSPIEEDSLPPRPVALTPEKTPAAVPKRTDRGPDEAVPPQGEAISTAVGKSMLAAVLGIDPALGLGPAEPSPRGGRSSMDAQPLDALHGGYPVTATLPAGTDDSPPNELLAFHTSADLTGITGGGKRPVRSGLLIVSEKPEGANQFGSLAAACAAATDGDVIELCFQEVKEERPIRLANLRLTIRAGEGYRPVIAFRPNDPDPVACPRSMITAAGGRLTLGQLSVEMTIPPEISADRWSLFETRGGQTVRLEKCVLTIRNATEGGAARHRNVATFRAVPPRAVLGDEGAESPAIPPLVLELIHCVVRGEAVMLKAENLQPVRLLWQNGLLATTESFLSATGGAGAAGRTDAIEVDLQHVTALVRGGLCVFEDTKSEPFSLPAEIRAANSILVGTSKQPMIQQVSAGTIDAIRRRFSWDGDHNVYQDFDTLWMVRSSVDDARQAMAFDEWAAYWGVSDETLSSQLPIRWKKLPEATRVLHTLTPEDFALSDTGDKSRTAGMATDGGKVGQRTDLLPSPPR